MGNGAVQEPILAVLNFRSPEGAVREQVLHKFTDLVRLHFVQVGSFRVIDKTSQEDIFREQSDSLRDCYNEECIPEQGKLLSTQKLVTGNVMRFGEKCIFAMQLLDVETGLVEKGVQGEANCNDENGFPTLAAKLVDAMTGRLDPLTKISVEPESSEEGLKKITWVPPPRREPFMTTGSIVIVSGMVLMFGGLLAAGLLEKKNEKAAMTFFLVGLGGGGVALFGTIMKSKELMHRR